MVMKMNKTEFIKELQNRLNYDEEKCTIINDILEDNFLIGKKNKEIMINEFITKLDITDIEANKIYETAMNILSKGIKDKLKHPFRSRD